MKKICFVIMGFGIKTDFETSKTFDLDKTYLNIIKPAVTECDLICLRSDEFLESGIIDKSLYYMLMRAEIVIADITTNNANAIYELGVRHALKPYSTIIINEVSSKFPFDLNHNRILRYKHLGEDIGFDEANQTKDKLKELIMEVIKKESNDSPVYEFLDGLNPPIIEKQNDEQIINDLIENEKNIFALLRKAKNEMQNSNFQEAIKYWDKALNIFPLEAYFIQQKTLCIYKSKFPSEDVSLTDALNCIKKLLPSNDPETIGLVGSIYKNKFLLNNDIQNLKRAIEYYEKIFMLTKDYYNGENLSTCYLFMAERSENENEKIYYMIASKKVIQEITIILNCKAEILNESPIDKWIFATLAHCYFHSNDINNSNKFEDIFLRDAIEWETETYFRHKEFLKKLKENLKF